MGEFMRALSYKALGLVLTILLGACGEPSTSTVFTPTEPEPVAEPDIEEPAEEATEEGEAGDDK